MSKAVPVVERSDGSLLRLYRSGSEEAASMLYRRYAWRLRSLVASRQSPALRRLLDPEDMVQSVFRRFFGAMRRGAYEAPAGHELWALLSTIALNDVATKFEHHRAKRRDLGRTEGAEALEGCAAVGTGEVLERLIAAERLGTLSAEQRRVVELRLIGCEVSEIAERIGRSRRTVERLLQECRRELSTGEPG